MVCRAVTQGGQYLVGPLVVASFFSAVVPRLPDSLFVTDPIVGISIALDPEWIAIGRESHSTREFESTARWLIGCAGASPSVNVPLGINGLR
jgi:hypothetical protein